MDRARYFLSRIESTIFEQAVWNAMLPYKKKNSIRAIDVEPLENGRRRETRILYKSDLLFYIMVYTRLHSNEKLPAYRMLCIDEGQDLHKADYDLRHQTQANALAGALLSAAGGSLSSARILLYAFAEQTFAPYTADQ